MRAPLSWIRQFATFAPGVTGRELAEVLIRQGLEVETVETVGAGVTGPLVVGKADGIEVLEEFKKPIRFCQVDVGPEHGGRRGIVCGADNFAVGDFVVVALPGATLAGGVKIGSRMTYGHVSDGMICSERELGLGDDASGIIVLPTGSARPGSDAAELLGLGEEVLNTAVTPDRGYALSMRGIAREAAVGLACGFIDPGQLAPDLPPATAREPVPTESRDPGGCPIITMRTLTGFDAAVPTPMWLRNRLVAAGMRPISIVVDVTNYVMLETGQPLHAFDADKITGGLVARRAAAGESLTTLDGVARELVPEDLVIADDLGPLALAGTMGGRRAEITTDSTTLALEAANFDAVAVGRMSRRHRLSTEASRRFERGVDPALAPIASQRAAAMIMELAGGSPVGMASWGELAPVHEIELASDEATQVSGLEIDDDLAVSHLVAIGCKVSYGSGSLAVLPPSWRPDLRFPADLVEEILRLVGYEAIPAALPLVAAGTGLARHQRLRRRASQAAGRFGLTEVLSSPFVGHADFDKLGLDPNDALRRTVNLANPLSDEQPGMRTTLLPGLLAVAARNISRGAECVALFEIGSVFVPKPDPGGQAPVRPVATERPSEAELRELMEALPDQPMRIGAIICGQWEPVGWWGGGRSAGWADAVQAARAIAESAGTPLQVRQGRRAPFHPGRCAELLIGEDIVGHAGELHPGVAEAYGLPGRPGAVELDLDKLIAAASDSVPAPVVGTMPVAKEDLAVVVEESVPAGAVESALERGGGDLLESVRLFDVYRGPQIPHGQKSLAFSLRFRAPTRTLTADEVASVRAAALDAAGTAFGATLRGDQ